MADTKISALTAAAAALGADEVPVNEAGTTKKVTITQIGTLLNAFVGAKVYATSTQSISATTEVAVAFDSEEYDTNTFHDNVTNNSRFTIPSGFGGKYLLQVGGTIPNIGTTIDFKLNGTSYIRGTGAGSAAGNRNSTSGVAVLAVGDYVEAIVFAPSGTTIGHASALQEQMTMTITYLGG